MAKLRDNIKSTGDEGVSLESNLRAVAASTATTLLHDPTAPPPPLPNPRDPHFKDLCVLHIRAHSEVQRDAVASIFSGLAVEASIPAEAYFITGAEHGKFFTVKFNGDRQLARNRVALLFDLLKETDTEGNTSWRNFKVSPPRGDPICISFSKDDSIASGAERGHIIRLFDALKQMYPQKLNQMSLRKNQKKIICLQSWKPILSVKYNDQRRQPETTFDFEVARGLDPQFDSNAITAAADALRRIPTRV